MARKTKVVIVGGGFAGLRCYWELVRESKAEVMLVDRNGMFEYLPSLHLALVNSKKDKAISIPYSKVCGKHFIQEEVVEIKDNKVRLKDGRSLEADYVVVATGSRTNFFGNKNFEKYAMPVKTVADVKTIRQKLRKGAKVTVIGGGYTGVELASVLAEGGYDVGIVHSRERLLNTLSEGVSRVCEGFLKQHGARIYLNDRANDVTAGKVKLKSGEEIDSDVTIISSGILVNNEILGGNVKIDDHLEVEGQSGVFVCGDVCEGTTLPTAHNAMVEGGYVGRVIKNKLNGTNLEGFSQDKDWRILAVALGEWHGLITFGQRGVRAPWITGLGKLMVEKAVLVQLRFGWNFI